MPFGMVGLFSSDPLGLHFHSMNPLLVLINDGRVVQAKLLVFAPSPGPVAQGSSRAHA
jgi:hypothetical protein